MQTMTLEIGCTHSLIPAPATSNKRYYVYHNKDVI